MAQNEAYVDYVDGLVPNTVEGGMGLSWEIWCGADHAREFQGTKNKRKLVRLVSQNTNDKFIAGNDDHQIKFFFAQLLFICIQQTHGHFVGPLSDP